MKGILIAIKSKIILGLWIFLMGTFLSYTNLFADTNKNNITDSLKLDRYGISGEIVLNRKETQEDKQNILPYHASYYGKFDIKGYLLPNIRGVLTLLAVNNNICGSYYEHASLNYRFFIEYESRYRDVFDFKTRCGDLGRITIGKGLTLDEIESDGLRSEFTFKKFNLIFMGLPVGLTGNEDIYLLRLTHPQGYYGLTFVESVFQWSWGKANQPMFSLDGQVPFLNHFSLYSEIAGLRNEVDNEQYGGKYRNQGIGFLSGINFNYEDKNNEIKFATEFRKYERNFNNLYVLHLGKVYQNQDTEDKKINNWRNYLLFIGDVEGMYFQGYIKKRIYKPLSWLVEGEYLDINHNWGTKNFFFYNIGAVLRFAQNSDLFLTFSNKAINNPDFATNNWLKSDFMFLYHRHLKLQVKIKF